MAWISQQYLQPLIDGSHGLRSHLNFSVNAAGLVFLADLTTIQLRSALLGTPSLLDALLVCPGAHRQQDGPELSKGEYPACAAMTTGYVFRVENEAMVLQLQRLGKSGHLTTLHVSEACNNANKSWLTGLIASSGSLPSMCYAAAVVLTCCTLLFLAHLNDLGAVVSLLLLILTRLINVIIFRRRAKLGWKGAREPGVQGDLIVLLSQDRWIRIRGLVDDLKAVLSGQWLRDISFLESSMVSTSKLIVYLNAAVNTSTTKEAQVVLLALVFTSAGLLGVANHFTRDTQMYGRRLRPEGPAKAYGRRLDLAEQLIHESGRRDWAVGLGMVQPDPRGTEQGTEHGPVIM